MLRGRGKRSMYIIASLIIPSVTSLNLNNLFFLKARDFQVNLMSLYANAVVLATYSHFTLIETTWNEFRSGLIKKFLTPRLLGYSIPTSPIHNQHGLPFISIVWGEGANSEWVFYILILLIVLKKTFVYVLFFSFEHNQNFFGGG